MKRSNLRLLASAAAAATLATHVANASSQDAQQPIPPFDRFTGKWTLQDDQFEQVWDGETIEQLTIPDHFTRCAPVNTNHSSLCVVDAGGLKGHILWVAADDGRSVHHLSHFGTSRVGVGIGQLSDTGDLKLRIEFADEPAGTYRLYSYKWIDADTYEMKSIQYNSEDEPTGNWYGGTFVRLSPSAPDQ